MEWKSVVFLLPSLQYWLKALAGAAAKPKYPKILQSLAEEVLQSLASHSLRSKGRTHESAFCGDCLLAVTAASAPWP